MIHQEYIQWVLFFRNHWGNRFDEICCRRLIVTVGLIVTVCKYLLFSSSLLCLQFRVGLEQTSVVTEVIDNLVVVVNVFVIRMDRVVVYIHVNIHVRRVVDHPANVAKKRSAPCVTGTRHIIVFSWFWVLFATVRTGCADAGWGSIAGFAAVCAHCSRSAFWSHMSNLPHFLHLSLLFAFILPLKLGVFPLNDLGFGLLTHCSETCPGLLQYLHVTDCFPHQHCLSFWCVPSRLQFLEILHVLEIVRLFCLHVLDHLILEVENSF